MSWTERCLFALLALAVGAAAYAWGRGPAPAAAASANANRDMIAVTGEYGMGTSVLYLVDTRKKVLLVYEARGGTQGSVRLLAARSIRYDLELQSYQDRSDAKMSVPELERRWRELVKRQRPGRGKKRQGEERERKSDG